MPRNKNKIILISALFSVMLLTLTAGGVNAGDYELKKVIIGDEKLFSIECRDVEIKDLLRAIAKENGLNLIVAEEISATVTLSFENISLKDALDSILKANKLDYAIDKNVIRIVRAEVVEKKEDGEIKVVEPEVRLVTAIVKLNYAQASELADSLAPAFAGKGTATFDTRTNSLILNVPEDNLEHIKSIISKLDTQTKQIMIRAKIVETTSDYSKQLGIQWGGNYSMDPRYGTSTDYNFPNTGGVYGSSGDGTYAVNMPSTDATSGIGINFGSINKAINLDMRLSAMEKNGAINIVSKPHITTMNNKPAKIHSGITFRVRTSSNVTSGTSTTTESELEQINAGIDLVVTPSYTRDGFIELNIDATKSEPDFSKVVDGIPGIIDKNANTTVLVKDGETTVIGGLVKDVENNLDQSVPFLSKIPIIGWLFKSKTTVDTKEELLIFITPTLVTNENIAVSE